MTFTIWFLGMIVHHIIDSQSARAILVKPSVPHVARMVIADGDIIAEANFASTQSGGFHVYDLAGRSLVIETPPGDVSQQPSFQDHVMHLKYLSKVNRLKQTVNLGEPDPSVGAYVSYTGGCLSVAEVFDEDVTFPPDSAVYVLDKKTVFAAATTGDVVIIDQWSPGASIRVKGSASIEISNLDPSMVQPSHFQDYALVTDGGTVPALVSTPKKQPQPAAECFHGPEPEVPPMAPARERADAQRKEIKAKSTPVNLFTIHADCSNTTWP